MLYPKKIFLLVLVSFSSYTSVGQINTEAIEAYFHIADSLETGKVISEDTWNLFFNMAGNSAFLQKYSRAAPELKRKFRITMEQIYGPSKTDRESNDKDLFRHDIVYLYKNEVDVKNFIKSLQSTHFIDSIYKQAYTFLPKRLQQPVKNLQIYFSAPIVPEAFAKGYTIYLNTAIEHMVSHVKLGSVASHELHHLLLEKLKPKNIPSGNEIPIIIVLNHISREGIADLIDKKYLALLPDTLYSHLLKRGLSKSDSIIIDLNHEIERLGQSTEIKPIFNPKLLRGFTGHIPGYYMAQIIERNGYLDELLTNIENPISFICLYNLAAKRDKTKPASFSDNTIRFLKKIDSKIFSQ